MKDWTVYVHICEHRTVAVPYMVRAENADSAQTVAMAQAYGAIHHDALPMTAARIMSSSYMVLSTDRPVVHNTEPQPHEVTSATTPAD